MGLFFFVKSFLLTSYIDKKYRDFKMVRCRAELGTWTAGEQSCKYCARDAKYVSLLITDKVKMKTTTPSARATLPYLDLLEASGTFFFLSADLVA